MEQEDFMLIRIRRHDKKCKEIQVAVSEVIITIVFTILKGSQKGSGLNRLSENTAYSFS